MIETLIGIYTNEKKRQKKMSDGMLIVAHDKVISISLVSKKFTKINSMCSIESDDKLYLVLGMKSQNEFISHIITSFVYAGLTCITKYM